MIDQINKIYFWDIDAKNLDEDKSKRLIIERVMNLGNFDEIKLVETFYGKAEVIKTVCNLAYIDPKTLNFLSIYFEIPKTEFKCFSREQSIQRHWSY